MGVWLWNGGCNLSVYVDFFFIIIEIESEYFIGKMWFVRVTFFSVKMCDKENISTLTLNS